MRDIHASPISKVHLKQILVLTLANLKSRYRKTLAGFFWVVINPMVMFGVQHQIFHHVLKINAPNYAIFLMSGLLPWIFVTQTLEMSTPLIQVSGPILKAFPVHPLVMLSAQLMDNLTNFFAAFFLIIIGMGFFQPVEWVGILFLPIIMAVTAISVLGFSWLLATAQVFFRDTKFIMSFVYSFSFFLTPVFYPITYIPERFRWAVEVNPFYIMISPYRAAIYSFDFWNLMDRLGRAMAFAVIIVTISLWVWNRKKNDLYFRI